MVDAALVDEASKGISNEDVIILYCETCGKFYYYTSPPQDTGYFIAGDYPGIAINKDDAIARARELKKVHQNQDHKDKKAKKEHIQYGGSFYDPVCKVTYRFKYWGDKE